MTTTVPKPTFGSNGFSIPDEATEVLPAVKTDINAAFDNLLDMQDSSPQGQLAATMAALVGFANDTFLFMTQMMDPAYAFGRYQDALARIYFIYRNGAQPTVVTATLTGLSGTFIAAGDAQAVAADGNIYINTADITIPSIGSVDASFSCNVPGPITCPAGTLTTIYRAVAGWDTITNAADGVVGSDTESRYAFESRRFDSVANNSVGMLPSVLGTVLGVSGVLDAYVTENYTASPVTVRNVTIAAHSLYVCASGGSDADVANAIWTKKAPGCDYTGNTAVTVYDTNYDPPYPSYTVTFERPSTLTIIFEVTLVSSTQVPADAGTLVAAAIVAAFAGTDGGPRARIASDIYASRFYAGVAALGTWAQIRNIKIGSLNTAAAKVTGYVDDGSGSGSPAPSGHPGQVMTVTAVAAGALATGQTVLGSSISDGTIILSQTSGTPGGVGVYQVSLIQQVGSETIYGVLANQDTVSVNADQIPATAAANVTTVAT